MEQPQNDALAHAVAIQRRSAPKDWPAQIAALAPEHRAAAESYLRTIAHRIRTVRLARAKR